MDSTDVNSALEKYLESDDEKDNMGMEGREHVSSVCLPNRLAKTSFCLLRKRDGSFKCNVQNNKMCPAILFLGPENPY